MCNKLKKRSNHPHNKTIGRKAKLSREKAERKRKSKYKNIQVASMYGIASGCHHKPGARITGSKVRAQSSRVLSCRAAGIKD